MPSLTWLIGGAMELLSGPLKRMPLSNSAIFVRFIGRSWRSFCVKNERYPEMKPNKPGTSIAPLSIVSCRIHLLGRVAHAVHRAARWQLTYRNSIRRFSPQDHIQMIQRAATDRETPV